MREVKYLVAVLPTSKSKGSLALTEVSGSFACQEKSMGMLRAPVAKSLNVLPTSAAKLLGVSVCHLCKEEAVVAMGTQSVTPPLVTEM